MIGKQNRKWDECDRAIKGANDDKDVMQEVVEVALKEE